MHSNEGRVEVFYNGSWGSICDYGGGYNDAKVVCRMVGYMSAVRAYEGSTFGQGSGSVWLDEVECTGDERELDECAHREYGDVVNCRGHSRDAGVACSGKVVTSRPFFKPP